MYHEQFVALAAYNAWANARLYDVVASMDNARFHEDRGVFFRSLCGTLNHILTADRIWLRRLTGAGEAPDRLDAILFEDFDALRAARRSEDARFETYVVSLSEADLASTFRYSPITRPEPVEGRVGPTLLHVFNHQTHHRGQAHAVLTGFGVDAPSLDMIAFLRETGRA
ncbi:DinB family protein [Aureimonas sp. ME7]|uniref:DinB family protein n=1 Tax=Aureimonas sp. ME7 TaxID=2744252 RepID=UPI0015F7746A|nr:DinB family protein [Aureimonas sp. ME7]